MLSSRGNLPVATEYSTLVRQRVLSRAATLNPSAITAIDIACQ
jgi:hypothetical protein